ncbi:hypothetical protein [Brevibacillus sp. MER 51]|uniref:hypothetical protein n=1 Tax=Brevibacillus sp. MER 51 TaxID=2939560 RepID=UPI00203F2690|nr:hypothetical protein [Brevibacillus sp. MER 51]MCM3145025.1 hypothetical protein [Brevibacillus sp. MER 51]
MIKKLMTLGAVVSALTFGSQAVFANDIPQTEKLGQEKAWLQGGSVIGKEQQKNFQIKNVQQQSNENIFFRKLGLRNTDGWIAWEDYTKFTVNYYRIVEITTHHTGQNADIEYVVVCPGKEPKTFQIKGEVIGKQTFWLPPGEYYVNFRNLSSDPADVSVSVNQYM